jgi:hypothetical protein
MTKFRQCPSCGYPGAASEFTVVDPYSVGGKAWQADALRQCPVCPKRAPTSSFAVIPPPPGEES